MILQASDVQVRSVRVVLPAEMAPSLAALNSSENSVVAQLPAHRFCYRARIGSKDLKACFLCQVVRQTWCDPPTTHCGGGNPRSPTRTPLACRRHPAQNSHPLRLLRTHRHPYGSANHAGSRSPVFGNGLGISPQIDGHSFGRGSNLSWPNSRPPAKRLNRSNLAA